MQIGMLVERRRDDFAGDRAREIRNVFGPLVDEHRDDLGVGMFGPDRIGDFLDERRLAGFGRRRNEDALAFADRREKVDDARRNDAALFEREAFAGMHRGQRIELRALANRFGIETVDGLDFDDAVVLLVVFRFADLSRDQVAAPQFEAPDLRLRDIDVVGAGQIARAA